MLEWRVVPAGPFTMGSDPTAAYPPDADEQPRRLVRVEPFRLARTPVTIAQYRRFAMADGDDGLPVTYVSLADATAYCEWAGVRLPTEAEWEAAARGGHDRLWPWGDELPDASRAHFAAGIGSPEPVGRRPGGASRDGVLDLAGNVMEWTASRYEAARPEVVVRGGSFVHGPDELRCSYRQPMHPGARDHYVGFRVATGAGEAPSGFDWVDVPAGEVALGRDAVAGGGAIAADELPAHVVDVAAFEVSVTPVTNAQYALFVTDGGADPPPDWAGGDPPTGRADHPVAFVDWFDAQAYCAWTGARLPTEAEWEKAARGADGRVYPWGGEADPSRAAIGAGAKHGTTVPVDAHASGASPYGLLGMAGNVWEWVSSAYRPYPYDAADGREDPVEALERVLRGGSFMSPELRFGRCAMRSRSAPRRRQAHIGFRVARGGTA
jgi:formylglycine-generating enzyme required for sulfatase activity